MAINITITDEAAKSEPRAQTIRVEYPDPRDARITELERELAEARAEVEMPSGWRLNNLRSATGWLHLYAPGHNNAVASISGTMIDDGAVQALRAFAAEIEKGGGK